MKKQFSILTIILLLSTSQVFAGFSLSGSTITQTSADTVTSATTISGTTKSIENNITIFDFGNKTLVVNGTINLNEGVAFHNVQLSSSSVGTINLGTIQSDPLDYSYNNNVEMLRSNTLLSNTNLKINSYGQLLSINGDFEYLQPITWVYTKAVINGRIDSVGAGTWNNNDIAVLGAFPHANFIQTNFNSFDGNTLVSPAYFALSWTTPVGTYNFKNIPLRSGQSLAEYGKNTVGVILSVTNVSLGDTYSVGALDSTRNYDIVLMQKILQTVKNLSFNDVENAIVYLVGNAGETEVGTTNASGFLDIDYQYHTNLIRSGVQNRSSRVTNNKLKKRVFHYNYNVSTEEIIDLKRAEDFVSNISLIEDSNITETNQVTVDAYTSIDNLDKLYDRAKSWKVDLANIEYPTVATQPVTASGTALDLGNRNLVIDNTAPSAFAVNTGTNTITIKASVLIGGSKFTNIKTTGTISTAGGSSLEIGYQDTTGTYKYIALSNLTNSDILIRDNTTGPATNIVSVSNFTGDYKAHFLAPTDASNTEIIVSRANYSSFNEAYPENDLSFIRTVNLQLTQVVAESQIEMLNLAIKILQKEEALYRSLDLTNPPMTITNTISGSSGSPSVDNQEAILNILNKVFTKVIANRRKLE